MRVVALFRVSTEKQANKGASLDAQERRYGEMAKANGWTTVAKFRGCESATQAATDRRVLQQVLECIRGEEPDAVYIHEQSRLTRGDELEVALLMRELRERNIKIIVGGVVRDLASIDERFMVGIQSLVDRAESDRFKERVLRGKREKARQGKKNCGRAPYGYVNMPAGHPLHGTLQVIPEQAEIVRRIFEMRASGISHRRICLALRKEGIASPRGSTWGKTTLRRILDNPAYIGTHVSFVWVRDSTTTRYFRFDLNNPKSIIVEDAHEPIVSQELWDAVHGIPKLPRTASPGLLTGLLHVNGARYALDSAGTGKCLYSSRIRGNPWLALEETNDAIWTAFVSLATDPSMVAAMIAQSRPKRSRAAIGKDIQYLESQLTKCRKRLDRLIDMRADGEIGKEAYLQKSIESEERFTSIEQRLRELRNELITSDCTRADQVVRMVRTLLGGRTKLDIQQKRAVLRSIVSRIDANAVRRTHGFNRDKGGRVLPATISRWRLTDVTFRLGLPKDGSRELDRSSECCARRPLRSSWRVSPLPARECRRNPQTISPVRSTFAHQWCDAARSCTGR